MPEARELITENNVVKTYRYNKWVCFVLKNGMTVKLNPNQASKPTKAIEKALA